MSNAGENIYRRKDGRWEARYITKFDSSGRAIYGSCYGKTYREAKDKRDRAIRGRRSAPETAGTECRKEFGLYCDEWLFLAGQRVKDSTYVKYEAALKNHIKPKLGEYAPDDLSTAGIGRFGQELLDTGLSPKTARDILAMIRSILDYIGTQESRMRAVKIVYPKYERKEMRVLTRQEQRRLTEYLLSDTDECKFGVLLALLTGLRIGEICALRWGDISFEERTLTVRSAMLRLKDRDGDGVRKTKVMFGNPKTAASARVIPLTGYIMNLCARGLSMSDDAFVLTGTLERYIEPRTLQYRLKKYTRECGLVDVHFHTLRHTFATRCVEVGFEIKSLSEILGHTNPKITLERYVHSSMDLKRENMNRLASIGY